MAKGYSRGHISARWKAGISTRADELQNPDVFSHDTILTLVVAKQDQDLPLFVLKIKNPIKTKIKQKPKNLLLKNFGSNHRRKSLNDVGA